MAGIVCAVRGGPESQPTIDRAIGLALEEALPLTFLYVVNLDFLDATATSRTQTITRDMEQLGEFILSMAQAKAEARGVPTDTAIRHGQVAEEIVNLCRETQAAILVIGRPHAREAHDVFTDSHHQAFIRRIEQQTGSRVVAAESP